MRALLVSLALLLLSGCGGLAQLRQDLDEFYANPAVVARRVAMIDAPEVTHLDAPAFLGSFGRRGLWQPLSFVKEKRGGVYLLEAYDPARVPVLFIHGAGGTPQDWRTFIGKLDRTKYQAWVYHYPTGLPIDLSAAWLNNFVTELHSRYGFNQLVIAAHSMGGLVAHRFIALNTSRKGNDYVKVLASFATPWGGVPAARLGVAGLGAYAVPSWRDLVPESELLRTVQAESLPPEVKHHVFFGYRESGDAFDSDGVISVASQIQDRAEADAAQLHGFRTDHSGILEDPAVFSRFAGVLAGFN
jgi:pimeloyl-ACP methyl ester carboxylesterase